MFRHILRANSNNSVLRIIRSQINVKNWRLLSNESSKDKAKSGVLTVQKNTELELMDPEIKEHKKLLSETKLTIDEPLDISTFSGVPKEHIYERRVRISNPRRMPCNRELMTRNSGVWTLRIGSAGKTLSWAGPQRDPLSNMNLWFSTAEDAAHFCEKNGWYYEIDEPQQRRNLNKQYADNFSWNKRTRVGTK